MGLDFRGGNYKRRVFFGKRTVKEGEGAVIWNRWGTPRVVDHGKLCYMWFSTIRFMDRFVADRSEYLIVKYRDGRIEHIRGPVAMFENHIEHLSIQVKEAIEAGAAGAISGSAVVKIIEQNIEQPELMLEKLAEFITPMKTATQK